MKLENFKRALAEKTNVSYELLEERFDQKHAEYYSLENLIGSKKSAGGVILALCDWNNHTLEKTKFLASMEASLRGITDDIVESWPPNKDRFLKTKWDVRYWSSAQRAEWQKAMFALGVTWATSGTEVRYLYEAIFYYVDSLGHLTFGNFPISSFNSHKYKEMYFEDLFPAPEAASIEVGNPVEAPNKESRFVFPEPLTTPPLSPPVFNKAPDTEDELIALVKSSREYSEEPYILSLAPEGVMVRNDTDMFTIPKSFDLKKLGGVLQIGLTKVP